MKAENKTEMIKLRLTVEDKLKLQEICEKNHTTMSDYIRTVIARPPDITRREYDEAIQRTIYEIHKIGVNINQIAKKYNSGDYIEPSEAVVKQMNEIYSLLYDLIRKMEKR